MEFLILLLVIVSAVLYFKNNSKSGKISRLEKELQATKEEIVTKTKILESEKEELLKWKNDIEPQIPKWKEDSKLVTEHGDMSNELESLKNEMASKKKEYEQFKGDISEFTYYQELEESGVYSYKFKFQDVEKYDKALATVKEAQKVLIKNEKAFKVGNKELVGSPIIKNLSKLCLTAFNSKCNELVNAVSFNNYSSCEDKLAKAFEQINKQVAPFQSEISKQYYKSKVKELALALEYEEEKKRIKDEQDEIKAQIREEQKEIVAAEKARDKAIEEEEKIEKALLEAKKEIEGKAEAERAEFEAKILELETQLKSAHENTERAVSNAQITSVGHVYIISNIGSFGENMYKIGMTRRDDPNDRVKELGDASVPFRFDVHAFVFSENARKLEADLHNYFEAKRVNKVNKRKEFFSVSLEEIEKACSELKVNVKMTKLAEAREFRESLEIDEEVKAA